ncbi:CapA family protein [Crassaminicella profunda]|uniref:CapA family protein n=1 Tax=Crassaminicella profunda TaxID=1286698 RepID=UPI001CA63AC3|nr:CapA family protein [Crassaminicella profunda]QZY53583.1 CapA family protein [Crassaminicella profunda]
MKKIYVKGIISFIIIMLFMGTMEQNQVHLIFVGDILLDRGVRKVLNEKGYNYPYMDVKDILKKGDISFGNLENPITQRGVPAYKRKDLIFRGDIKNTKALKEAGFDILNLANNHAMDYKSIGIMDTIDLLEKEKIKPLGFSDPRKTENIVVMKRKGIRFGYLGYSIFPPEGYIYSKEREDILRVNMKTIGETIRKAKKMCDYLIISFHWGNEYEFYPSDYQKNLAHIAIDQGANLVIGHHSHVLQGVERYKNKLIFYSLGNFIFDRQMNKGTDETIMVDVTVEKDQCKGVRLIPIKIKNCQPNIAKEKNGEYILKRLKMYSRGLIDEIEIRNGLGYIK